MDRIILNIIIVKCRWSSLRMLVLLIFISGCIQKFDYDPSRSDKNILVVSGGITNQPVNQTIQLSRTTTYGSGTYDPESGAQIIIFENSKAVDTCVEIAEGTYQFNGGRILPKPGNRYSLEITTPEGKVYESDPETMPEPVQPDTAYLEVHIDKIPSESGTYVFKPSINIYVDTPVRTSSGPAFLRWQVIEHYSFREIKTGQFSIPKTCYMGVNPVNYQDIQLYSGADLKGGILKRKLVLSRTPYPYAEFTWVHSFLISQYNLTPTAFEYWSKLQQVANPTGSFLEPPPAAVIGNIHNVIYKDEIVLGYFEVAAREYATLFTIKADLKPLFIKDPCTDNVPGYCFDCLKLPYSGLDWPSYWPPY